MTFQIHLSLRPFVRALASQGKWCSIEPSWEVLIWPYLVLVVLLDATKCRTVLSYTDLMLMKWPWKPTPGGLMDTSTVSTNTQRNEGNEMWLLNCAFQVLLRLGPRGTLTSRASFNLLPWQEGQASYWAGHTWEMKGASSCGILQLNRPLLHHSLFLPYRPLFYQAGTQRPPD